MGFSHGEIKLPVMKGGGGRATGKLIFVTP